MLTNILLWAWCYILHQTKSKILPSSRKKTYNPKLVPQLPVHILWNLTTMLTNLLLCTWCYSFHQTATVENEKKAKILGKSFTSLFTAKPNNNVDKYTSMNLMLYSTWNKLQIYFYELGVIFYMKQTAILLWNWCCILHLNDCQNQNKN